MDIAILGVYGSAGVAAADELSTHAGDKIDNLYLIDGGEPGGLCILEGCMPSKAVLSSAKHAHDARSDPRVNADVQVNTKETIEDKNKHISSFAHHREQSVKSIAQSDSVQLIEKDGYFRDENTIELEDGSSLSVDYSVVATGSSPNIPSIDGIDQVDYLTSSDLLDMKSLPDSMAIIGFGAIGMEMSAYLASSGVDVTVVEHDESPIDNGSEDFGDELMDIYREEFGIDIITESYEQSVEKTDDGIRLELESTDVHAEKLCVFAGRVPNTQSLGLENITDSVADNWYDDDLKVTSTDSVYVAGDATGDRMILHIAKEQGLLVAENIMREIRGESIGKYSSPEHLVYFTGNGKYPFVRYGISGDEAEQKDDLLTISRKASTDGIFGLKNADKGLAKMVVEKDTGVIRGYEGLHLHADVMLKTMQVLIEQRAEVSNVPSRAYHPTTPELLDGLFREATERTE